LAIWIYLFSRAATFGNCAKTTSICNLLQIGSRHRIVPARNEAENIAKTVHSLAAQEYPGEFSIIIVDTTARTDRRPRAKSRQ